MALSAELFRHNVSVLPPGGEEPLPSPGDSAPGYRALVNEPIDGFRPAGTEAIDVIRWCFSHLNPVRR